MRFQGSYRDRRPKLHNDGRRSWGPRRVLLALKEVRRAEAIERNERTPHERRRAHRENRCDGSCKVPA